MQTVETSKTDVAVASCRGTTAAASHRHGHDTRAPSGLSRNARFAMALVALGAISLALDLRVSEFRPELSPYDFRAELWTLPELFGDGLGIILFVCVVFLMCRDARSRLPRVLACAFLAGALASLLKPIVLRLRPRALEGAESVWDTFHGSCLWSSSADLDSVWNLEMTSCPSSHTAAAAGFAVGLAWLWPNWRVAFGLLAAVVAAQRIVVGAHFLSDTLWGAALGLLVASLCLDPSSLGKWFDKLESHLARYASTATTSPPREPKTVPNAADPSEWLHRDTRPI